VTLGGGNSGGNDGGLGRGSDEVGLSLNGAALCLY
jgi:hypothetical protein